MIYIINKDKAIDLIPFGIAEEQEPQNRLHKFYVGIDIGYKFHEAACIQPEDFVSTKQTWLRSKTLKFNADYEGINQLTDTLNTISSNPKDFYILLEPTGGHYGYIIMQTLIDMGYTLFQVENKAVKDFRERHLGVSVKSDSMDARIMANMGFHKALHPSMKSIRLVLPSTPKQVLFRVLIRDRWLLSTQLTKRKNQITQLLAVTHPELKYVFTSVTKQTILRLILKYPTAIELSKESVENIKSAIMDFGGRAIASKKAPLIKEQLNHMRNVSIVGIHLIRRQKWLAEDIFRLNEALKDIDSEMKLILYGSEVDEIQPHPYTSILNSLPVMSDIWLSTLIGVIGDVHRFETYKRFKKYLGFAAETSTSGISVNKNKLTNSGVRDTRRILFQMAIVLLSPRIKSNVFRLYYQRLINGRKNKSPIAKMKAIGHVCGKLSDIIYACLKHNKHYDQESHAKRMGFDIKELSVPYISNE